MAMAMANGAFYDGSKRPHWASRSPAMAEMTIYMAHHWEKR